MHAAHTSISCLLLSLLPLVTGEAEAQAARLREQLQQQEGRASSLAAQADEAQRQLAAWQVGCTGGWRCYWSITPGLIWMRVRVGMTGLCFCCTAAQTPLLHVAALHSQGQAAELEGAQRTMEGLVDRMFAAAGGRQAELADAAGVLEGQAAEVGSSSSHVYAFVCVCPLCMHPQTQ